MSSHHIVREAQEPALIIAHGEECSDELLGQLLEWSPYIVVLDGALPKVHEKQIKIDVVLGDFDRQNVDEIRQLVTPETEIIHTPDQNKTDLEKGIEYLIDKNFEAVNIIWATGKRSDHYMNNIATLARYADRINLVMIDNHSRIYPVRSGFKKHFQKGFNVSLIPLNNVKNLKTENLEWNINGRDLEFPFETSSSNKIAETGMLSLHFDSGVLLLMECVDIHI